MMEETLFHLSFQDKGLPFGVQAFYPLYIIFGLKGIREFLEMLSVFGGSGSLRLGIVSLVSFTDSLQLEKRKAMISELRDDQGTSLINPSEIEAEIVSTLWESVL